MDEPGFIRFLFLFLLLVGAAYTDIAHRKIYNWMTFPAIGVGFLLATVDAMLAGHLKPFIPCTVGFVVGLIFLIPYFLGWVSGGDVKLMAAIGALQGPPLDTSFIFHVIFFTALVGCCMALVLLIWEGRLLSGLIGSVRLLFHPKSQQVATEAHGTIPYGVAMVAGTIWTLIMTFVTGV